MKSELTYAEMFRVLCLMFWVSEARRPAFTGKVQDLQRKGLAGRGAGRAGRTRRKYSADDVLQYVVALDFMELGLPVSKAAELGRDALPEVCKGALSIRYDLFGRRQQIATAINSLQRVPPPEIQQALRWVPGANDLRHDHRGEVKR